MQLFTCIVLGFAFVVNSNLLDETIKEAVIPHGADLTFNDVIQNISSVNNVLKSLIQNYKHLKKICDSDESKGSKQVGDSIEKYQEPNLKLKSRNQNDYPKSEEDANKLNAHYVTRMFYSDEKVEDTETSSGEQNVMSYDNEDRSTESETSEENIEEKPGQPENKKDKKEMDEENKNVKENDKKKIDIVVKDKKTTDIMEIENNKDGLEISITNKVNVEKEGSDKKLDKKSVTHKLPRMQLVRQMIIETKGVKRSHVNKTKKKRKMHHHNSLRRIPAQSTLIIIANSSSFDQKDELFDHEDENDFINSEQFKTDVLRSTYSDACIKLVIRKCYKACKRVYKRVCHRYRCVKDFKSKYEISIRRGCIKFFDIKKKDKTFRGGKDAANEDFTKGEYLAAACFPYEKTNKTKHKRKKGKPRKLKADKKTKIKKNKRNHHESRVDDEEKVIAALINKTTSEHPNANTQDGLEIEKFRADNETKIKNNIREQHELGLDDGEKHIAITNETTTPIIEDLNTNILRDRLEKECLKISNSKCKKSCRFGYKEACKAQKCNKDKRKEFKNECKIQCHKAFNGRTADKDSDSRSSSKSSSSSEGSESDSSSKSGW